MAFTLVRLLVSYVIALTVAIPLALLVVKNSLAEKILFPILDILQSIPVLAFFPFIIILFLKINFFEGAAIFILSTTMLWEIVFTLIGGLKVLPEDINSAAKVFGIKGFNFVRRISLPSIVPHVITGSLIGWAEGWNIVIVAEVLHNYIPQGTTRDDLFGIGSIMSQASISGRKDIMIASLIVMIITIAFMNLFVWQKLLHYSEKYKYD
jgi:NitT/TauT family transport system permease protein